MKETVITIKPSGEEPDKRIFRSDSALGRFIVFNLNDCWSELLSRYSPGIVPDHIAKRIVIDTLQDWVKKEGIKF